MAKHVVSINDGWDHKPSEDCSCKYQVVTDKDGELVYLHEDLSRREPRRKKREDIEADDNTTKLLDLRTQQDNLIAKHNELITKAIDSPKDYGGGVVQELNNGILIRLEYLARQISLLEHGSN